MKKHSANVVDLVSIGDMAHYGGAALNLLLTSAIIMGFPSKDTYDEAWLDRGQCYSVSSGIQSTSTICCGVLCLSGIGLVLLSKLSSLRTKFNDDVAERLPRIAQALISHGLGHLFVHFIGNSIPRVELTFRSDALGYLLVLVAFWPTTLRSVAPRLSVGNACIISAMIILYQAAVDIEPNLQFTFSQSIILLVQGFDQIFLPNETKSAYPYTYLAFALYHLPIYLFMWLETTQCSLWYASFGGHAIYDAYLAMMPFVIVGLLQKYEPFEEKNTNNNKLHSKVQ